MLTYQPVQKPFKIGHMYFVYHPSTGFLMQSQYDGMDKNGLENWSFSHKLLFTDLLEGLSTEEVGKWLKANHGEYYVYDLVNIDLKEEIKKMFKELEEENVKKNKNSEYNEFNIDL